VEFDQSQFVRQAISTVLHEGAMGLILTGLMILLFLGSGRATAAVFLSIPLSAMVTFFCLNLGGYSINSMVLSGLALAFSRLIDNSVVVLENIYRHLELGESPQVAAQQGADEVALAVLAITFTTVVVFFPVTFLAGVSKFLFSALALAVVLALFASYFVSVSVVPLYCAHLLKSIPGHGEQGSESAATPSWGQRFHARFNRMFAKMLDGYSRLVGLTLDYPRHVVVGFLGAFALSLLIFPFLGFSFFPRTDAGQFVVNVKAPTGTRLEVTEQYIKRVEDIIRRTVLPKDLDIIVSNIGLMPDFSALFSSNAGMHTAVVEVGLKEGHKIGSHAYMDRVRRRIGEQLPELRTYFQSGGLVDAVLNQGAPAPIDVQVTGMDLDKDFAVAQELATKIHRLPGISDVYIPQDLDYPSLMVNVNRERASELGLSQKEVVDNLITALTSNGMVAPSYWVDPRSGNNYMVTVQYPENQVRSLLDLEAMPLHAPNLREPTYLNQVAQVTPILTPTEVDHYQIERNIDVYVAPSGEDLRKPANEIDKIIAQTSRPSDVRVEMRGLVQTMRNSFRSFGIGLLLAILLVFLILVAQFASFIDPFLILLAIPTGLMGVLITLLVTGTTLNIQSLMGVVMMTGMVVSNSILIVDFAGRLVKDGRPVREAVAESCRIRLRPILMTSLATIVGLLPMAFKLETGSEAYMPLAIAIIGGLTFSVILTIFVLPSAYLLIYGRKNPEPIPS
jgi:multidrug efflux pump subunit AcrB